jgi:hypothetical protein
MRWLAFFAVVFLAQCQSVLGGFSFTLGNPTGVEGTSITRSLFISALPGDGFTSLQQAEFNLSVGAGATISSFSIDPTMTGSFVFTPASTAVITGGGTGLTGRLYSSTAGTASVSNGVKLGDLTLALGTPGNVNLTFLDPGPSPSNPGGNNVSVNLGSPIDTQVFGSPQNVIGVSITAVPEPTSLVLLSLVGIGGAAWRLRKRVKVAN